MAISVVEFQARGLQNYIHFWLKIHRFRRKFHFFRNATMARLEKSVNLNIQKQIKSLKSILKQKYILQLGIFNKVVT